MRKQAQSLNNLPKATQQIIGIWTQIVWLQYSWLWPVVYIASWIIMFPNIKEMYWKGLMSAFNYEWKKDTNLHIMKLQSNYKEKILEVSIKRKKVIWGIRINRESTSSTGARCTMESTSSKFSGKII